MAVPPPIVSQETFKAMMADPSMKNVSPSAAKKILEAKGFQLEGVKSMPVAPSTEYAQSKTDPDRFIKGTKTFKNPLKGYAAGATGFLAGGINVAGNLVEAGVDLADKGIGLFTDKGHEARMKMKEAVAGTSDKIESAITYGDDSTEAKIGKFLGTAIGTIASIFTGASAAQAPLKAAQGANLLSKGSKAVQAGEFVAGSLGGTTGVTSALKGEMPTKKELAAGLALDAGGFLLFAKAIPYVARQLQMAGANTKASGMLPEQSVFKKADEAIEHGYVGTKQMLVNKARNIIGKSGSYLDDTLKQADETKAFTPVSPDTLTDLAQQKGTQFTSKTTQDAFTDTIDDWLNRWKKSATKTEVTTDKLTGSKVSQVVPTTEYTTLNAQALLKEKRRIADELGGGPLKKALMDETGAAKKQALAAIWARIDETLDAISPAVKKANGEMTLAYAIKEPLEKALSKSFLENMNFLSGHFFANLPVATPAATVLAQLANLVKKGGQGYLKTKKLMP